MIHTTEEHHLDNFDAGAFFSLHDFDSSGGWTPDEVRRFYGLEDESARDVVPASKKEEVTRTVFGLFDIDHNGVIEREEWLQKVEKENVRLPDFGVSSFYIFLGRYGILAWDLFGDEMRTKTQDVYTRML